MCLMIIKRLILEAFRESFEINLTFVPTDTWWLDSGATTHISVTMQGCLWSRPPSDDERFIFVGDSNKVAVEAIGTFRFQMKTEFCLDLFETFIVSYFRQNLVSISSLDRFGFSCSFGNNKVSLYQNSNVVGSGSLIDNLYMLDVVSSYNEILQIGSRDTKQKLIENLGKRTNIRKLGAERAKDVLELIHTDICGPFPTASWNGQQYFITFIDDYSRYGYLYLIHEKSQSLDVFKSFKAEVEQPSNLIVVANTMIRRTTSRPFALFIKEYGIVSQYTMPSKPSMNDIAERQNRTLKDMGEALKTAVHILNRVPTKAVNKTPYELWTGKRPSINHFHIWGCPAEARPYRPHERKLDSRIILFEMGNARILEEVEFGKEENIRNVVFEEESINDIGQVLVPITIQETTPVIGDNVQTTVPDIVPEQDCDEALPQPPIEQPQQPQQVSLRRSIRERRHAIPDDYIVFLQEHEDGIGQTEDDPINFCQAMQSFNSQK
ncbi:hypothetical protein CR513_23156, partial [Mucuna pruriens]